MKLIADLRLSAVVAAAVACTIIVVAHVWFNASFWLFNGLTAWTIYPPISALPQAIVSIEGDPILYYSYLGLILSATIAGGLSLCCLLASEMVRRWQPVGIAQRMLHLWLLFVLLLPLLIHLGGAYYRISQTEPQKSTLIQEKDFPETAAPQLLKSSAADSLTEAADDAIDDALEELE